MTARAILIGFAAALFIAGAGYVNDHVLALESFNNGHQIPIIVIGSLFLWVVLVNPVLGHVRQSLALRPAELALIVILAMAACGIPGRGLMEQFAQTVVMPHHWNRVSPGWQAAGLLDLAPERALVDPEPEHDVLNRFMTGAEAPQRDPTGPLDRLRLWSDRVPWRQWSGPLWTWGPMVMLSAVSMACMALIVHRQWSHHEHLQYPIAEFTTSLIEREPTRKVGPMLRHRYFWVAFAAMFLIRLNNGLHAWFPDYLVPVKLQFNLTAMASPWPLLGDVPGGYSAFHVNVFPLVIAFAFMLSSEIALTLGLSQALWVLFAMPMVAAGVSLSTDYDIGGWQGWQRAGSYTALAVTLLYAGRYEYGRLFASALRVWRPPRRADATAVRAARILLVAMGTLIGLAMRLGLHWPIALGTVLLMLMTFLIVSRISAETGLFFIQPGWQPYGALMSMFGAYAIGPAAIVISGLMCAVLCIDQSQALMPYLTNGLRIGERLGVAPGRAAGLTVLMYACGAALALFVVLAVIYDRGTPKYHYAYLRVPTVAFRAAAPRVLKLQHTDQVETSQALTALQRLAHVHAEPGFWWAAGSGFALVILCSVLRMRVSWWPLHPVLFLVWSTYPLAVMHHSFLLGWLAKVAVVRFAGHRLVQRLRPLALGVIAGEVCGALLFMLVGALYYFIADQQPVSYRFFPR